MNAELIYKTIVKSIYIAHTESSYHHEALDDVFQQYPNDCPERKPVLKQKKAECVANGVTSLLPMITSFLRGDKAPAISNTGRGSKAKFGKLSGQFSTPEVSPYKQNKPWRMQTSLWEIDDYPTWYYGTIGITGANGKIDRDNADLVILHTTDWKRVEVYILKGMAGASNQVEVLLEVMDCLTR